jgi:hypothetical protein
MNEFRSILLAEDNLNDFEPTLAGLSGLNHGDFISAIRQVGAFWAVVNEPPPEAMQ